MLVYEKKVDGVRHLFGNATGTQPTNEDVQLTYKKADGTTIEPQLSDVYLNDGQGGIVRKSDNAAVNVFIGETQIIGGTIVPVLTGIEVTAPTNVTYTAGQTLDLTGMVVKEVYSDGTKTTIATGFTTSPAAGATLATTDTKVTVTHTASSKTAEFAITVEAEGE